MYNISKHYNVLSNMMKVFILFSSLILSSNSVAQQDSSYTLGSGDLLRISVFGEPDLSMEQIRLNDAGTFSYPFLGIIRAKGETVAEVERKITAGLLGDYLINPKVTVSIIEYREFFINGEVRNPGGYPYIPGMTLRKAVALAGGFTERASGRSFNVIHEDDVYKTPQKANLSTHIIPGDIITIEQSFF